MRRQVRPFVTEVRASGRKAKDGGTSASRPEPSRDSDQPRGLFSASQNTGSDDSYEAALKAADALFSSARSAGSPGVTAERTAHEPSIGRTRSTADADAVFAPQAEPLLARHYSDLPEAGGRILRAIEVPSDPFAELEVEHAPKRRGRKPGSKNKPKILVPAMLSDAATPASKPLAAADRGATTHALDVGARTEALLALLSEPAAPITVAAAPARRVPGLALSAAAQRDRFTWVRTKLRPGENWKRRLPKVIW